MRVGSSTASTVPAVMPPCMVRYSASAGEGRRVREDIEGEGWKGTRRGRNGESKKCKLKMIRKEDGSERRRERTVCIQEVKRKVRDGRGTKREE